MSDVLVIESGYSFEDQLTGAIDGDLIVISVSAEKALDSYNETFECDAHLTLDKAIELHEWLGVAIARLKGG